MKKINLIVYNFVIILVFFILFETSLKIYFSQTNKFDCYKKVDDIRNYINKENCNFTERYFEKENASVYLTNSDGERIRNDKFISIDSEQIYVVGDSFTSGYLSNYKFTCPYNSI